MLHSVGLFISDTSSRMSALGFGRIPCVESARAILRILDNLLQIPLERRPPISLAYPLTGTYIIALRLLTSPIDPNTFDDFQVSTVNRPSHRHGTNNGVPAADPNQMLKKGCEACQQEYGRYGYTDYVKQFPLIVNLVSRRLLQSDQLSNSSTALPDMNGSQRQAQLSTNWMPPFTSDTALGFEPDDNLWQMFTQQASSVLPWSFDMEQTD